jgi:hypothetical protein
MNPKIRLIPQSDPSVMQTNESPSLVFFTNEIQSHFLVGEITNKGEEPIFYPVS